MSERYRTFANTVAGRAIVTRLGLPDPVRPRGQQPGEPAVSGPVRLGGGDRLREVAADILAGAGVATQDAAGGPAARGGATDARGGATDARGGATDGGDEVAGTGGGVAALVYDGTGLREPADLRELFAFFRPAMGTLRPY